jgi:hypothetical protein
MIGIPVLLFCKGNGNETRRRVVVVEPWSGLLERAFPPSHPESRCDDVKRSRIFTLPYSLLLTLDLIAHEADNRRRAYQSSSKERAIL